MLRNGHVRFGGRVGETDRRQRRHRAPARPDPSSIDTTRVFSGESLSPSGAIACSTSVLSASACSLRPATQMTKSSA
jgi:hypothetical protein